MKFSKDLLELRDKEAKLVKMKRYEEAEKVKIWSVGTDGKSQNGLGGWSKTPTPQDIVLEIPR